MLKTGILAGFLSLFAGPAASAQPVQAGSIEGRVVDARTGAGLAKVMVVVEGASLAVTTGDDGSFALAGVAPGDRRLSISVVGYIFVRRDVTVPPGTAVDLTIPLSEGDVDARVWVRVREAQESLTLIERMLDSIPRGPLCEDVRAREGEGLGLVEGFRGDVLIWLRLDAEGTIARCHVRDPSWLQWPLLEAAIEGNIVGDFPLCNKSFNCSYSGHDL